jgi:hypothetical protein
MEVSRMDLENAAVFETVDQVLSIPGMFRVRNVDAREYVLIIEYPFQLEMTPRMSATETLKKLAQVEKAGLFKSIRIREI